MHDDRGPQAGDRSRSTTLEAGQVGILAAAIKDIAHARVGDTVTDAERPVRRAAARASRRVKPMVFAGLFPVDAADYQDLKDALGKLVLNDASVTYEPETSSALGFGFRTGFLGLLHMEIIQERLEREFNLNLITTAPSVRYRVHHARAARSSRSTTRRRSPTRASTRRSRSRSSRRPCTCRRSTSARSCSCARSAAACSRASHYDPGGRVRVVYEMPLAEVVFGFYDRLKTMSRGYASLDYEPAGYRDADLIRLDVLVNGERVDALSIISHRDTAYHRGVELCTKMKDVVPRQMFDVAIQAAIGSRVISRTTVKAIRKDVTAKCYGGDITRKKKLLEKQKEGKKRMKSVGSVELPQEAFLTVLKVD